MIFIHINLKRKWMLHIIFFFIKGMNEQKSRRENNTTLHRSLHNKEAKRKNGKQCVGFKNPVLLVSTSWTAAAAVAVDCCASSSTEIGTCRSSCLCRLCCRRSSSSSHCCCLCPANWPNALRFRWNSPRTFETRHRNRADVAVHSDWRALTLDAEANRRSDVVPILLFQTKECT